MPAAKLAVQLPPFASQENPSLMLWIAPSEKDADNANLEKRLWDAAYQFRADSVLKLREYSAPGCGLILVSACGSVERLTAPTGSAV